MRFRLSKSISPFVSWEINRCVIRVVAAITLRVYEMHLFSLKIAFWRVENFLSFFNKFSEKRNWLTFQLNAALDVMTREHFGSREFVVRFIVVVVVLEVRAHPARRRSRAAPCQKFVSEAGTGGPLHALVHLKHRQRSCIEWRKYLAPSITRPSYWRSTLISRLIAWDVPRYTHKDAGSWRMITSWRWKMIRAHASTRRLLRRAVWK